MRSVVAAAARHKVGVSSAEAATNSPIEPYLDRRVTVAVADKASKVIACSSKSKIA